MGHISRYLSVFSSFPQVRKVGFDSQKAADRASWNSEFHEARTSYLSYWHRKPSPLDKEPAQTCSRVLFPNDSGSMQGPCQICNKGSMYAPLSHCFIVVTIQEYHSNNRCVTYSFSTLIAFTASIITRGHCPLIYPMVAQKAGHKRVNRLMGNIRQRIQNDLRPANFINFKNKPFRRRNTHKGVFSVNSLQAKHPSPGNVNPINTRSDTVPLQP